MPFFAFFFFLILELMVFLSVADEIGFFSALLLAFLAAILGGMIVRYQGFQTWATLMRSADTGEMPNRPVFDGFCLMAAGLLLAFPGFVSDAAGFLLLVPPVRSALRQFIKSRAIWGKSASRTRSAYGHYQTRHGKIDDGDIIEGEYRRLDDE